MKILFMGDVKFDRHVMISNDIIDVCQKADLVLANLEGPIADKKLIAKAKGTVRYSTDIALKYLKKLNVTAVNLANNHTMDLGIEGVRATLSKLKTENIDYFGIKESRDSGFAFGKIISAGSKRIGILSFAHREGLMASKKNIGPFPLPKYNFLEKAVSDFKKRAEKIYLLYHGGEEYFTVPWPRRMNYLRFVAEHADVDGIIGHHSHTVQPVDFVNGKPVVYSLGNFYFDSEVQKRHKFTDEGLMVVHDTNKNQVILYRTKLDRNRVELSLQTRQILSCGGATLSSQELHRQWLQQCTRRVRANRGFFSKKIFWKFGMLFSATKKSIVWHSNFR